ncbi:hypothetical protein [Streptomyces yanii]|uniref:Tetratricopeptide repeat protein n=1 Tax=Streptomyces yanii TaxID=78510 RepID=A0ABV5RCB5_9ACTN
MKLNPVFDTPGTPAERWERAGLLCEARDYITTAQLLDGLVREFPEQNATRLLLARP